MHRLQYVGTGQRQDVDVAAQGLRVVRQALAPKVLLCQFIRLHRGAHSAIHYQDAVT